MSAKYRPLADYLAGQRQDRVTLTLAEVEVILRQPLPGSAGLRWWWQSSRDARTWQAAGWRAHADAWGRRVTFERVPPDSTSLLTAARYPPARPSRRARRSDGTPIGDR